MEFILGSIYGHLIGDALGNPYKGLKENKISNKIRMMRNKIDPAGAYGANGCLMLATISSICDNNGIDFEDILEKMCDSYVTGYLSSTNNSIEVEKYTLFSIRKHINNIPSDRTGETDLDSNTFAPLCRILPVSLFCVHDSIDTLIEKTHRTCTITHAHIQSQVCCALYSLVVKQIYLDEAEPVFDLLTDYYKTKKMKEYLYYLQQFKNHKNHVSGGGANIQDCFWSSWHAYSLHQNDYKQSVSTAIKLGHNTEATGCITGSLSGLKLGISQIPNTWKDELIISEEIKELIKNFSERT